MLWLALYCPTLPLDCILRRWPEGLEPALAVTDLDGSRRLIAVATRKAQACGVFAGQSIATALSLLPDLILIARKLEDERVALVEAAMAALRFTPTVSLRASGLVMEISSSLKLFGGRRLLKKSLANAMQVQGLTIAAAEAPTPHGAWLLAQERARRRVHAERRSRPDSTLTSTLTSKATIKSTATATSDGAANGNIATMDASAKGAATTCDTAKGAAADPRPSNDFATLIDALPIGHLESARPSLQRLDGIGCHTLADLRRLPVKGLARRFGPALIDEMARAVGDKPDPQIVFEAPSRFETRIELMARVETADALVFASQRLLAQMSGWLTARRAAVRGFTLMLHHDRWTRDAIEPTAVAIALSTPSNDLARLSTLLRERLSRLELKAPVLELALEAPAIVEEREAHGTLFPEREQATETLARLLEKLTARLGPDAMKRLERVADHRPERAWRALSGDPIGASAAAAASKSRGTRGAPRRTGTNALTAPSFHGADGGHSVSSGTGDRRATTCTPLQSASPSVDDVPLAGADSRGADRPGSGSVSPSSDAESAPRPHGALSADHAAPAITPVRSPGCSCGPRPVWLLTEPQQLAVRAHRPVFESLPLDLLAGPERIETGWWDDEPVTRDYYIGENAAGRLVWIFRERLPTPGRDLWYLQGLFG